MTTLEERLIKEEAKVCDDMQISYILLKTNRRTIEQINEDIAIYKKVGVPEHKITKYQSMIDNYIAGPEYAKRNT